MRRTFTIGIFALLMLVAATERAPSPEAAGSVQAVTKADFERWKTELSNRAADLVKEGLSVSLAGDADTEKAIDNANPYEHSMLALGSDRFGVAFHGIAHTHLDSLAHVNYDGVFYNGYAPDKEEVMKRGGHALARESNCHILKA